MGLEDNTFDLEQSIDIEYSRIEAKFLKGHLERNEFWTVILWIQSLLPTLAVSCKLHFKTYSILHFKFAARHVSSSPSINLNHPYSGFHLSVEI